MRLQYLVNYTHTLICINSNYPTLQVYIGAEMQKTFHTVSTVFAQ